MTNNNRTSLRTKIAAGVLSAMALVSVVGMTASSASAAEQAAPTPTVAPEIDLTRAADKTVAPLNTAVVTANTGAPTAKIWLERWTGATATGSWVVEKSGTTNASGGATFRTVRGGAYYYWVTYNPATYFDGAGYLHACAFYTQSNPAGVWVARGATKAIPLYSSWNTCGA